MQHLILPKGFYKFHKQFIGSIVNLFNVSNADGAICDSLLDTSGNLFILSIDGKITITPSGKQLICSHVIKKINLSEKKEILVATFSLTDRYCQLEIADNLIILKNIYRQVGVVYKRNEKNGYDLLETVDFQQNESEYNANLKNFKEEESEDLKNVQESEIVDMVDYSYCYPNMSHGILFKRFAIFEVFGFDTKLYRADKINCFCSLNNHEYLQQFFPSLSMETFQKIYFGSKSFFQSSPETKIIGFDEYNNRILFSHPPNPDSSSLDHEFFSIGLNYEFSQNKIEETFDVRQILYSLFSKDIFYLISSYFSITCIDYFQFLLGSS